MDTEFKKLLNGGLWASAATDNIDPDSTSVTPVLSRTTGFPASYSQVAGDVPDRRRINQLLRELTGGAFELRMGVSPYDPEVNYPINAISAVNGRLYRAKVANGPATQNVTTPDPAGNAVWEAVSGAIGVPDRPFSFDFDNSSSGQLNVRWKDGRDNGARILTYRFQWRTSATSTWSPPTPITTQFAEYLITPVAPNTRIFVRARAVNDVGEGDWATDATGEVVTGTVPGGGASIGLLATAGDALADLSWQQPDTGGHPILRYIVQWRPTTSTFTTGNQTTVSDALTEQVTGLTNGVEHFFRVAAVNQIGQGPWSNIANATPMDATPSVFHPTLLAPSLSAGASASITATTNLQNSTEGTTANVTRTDWAIKTTSAAWSSVTPISVTSGSGLVSYTFTGLTNGQTYDVRYRVYTSANNTSPPWSPEASLAAQGAVPDAPISVSGSAWWRRTVGGIHNNAGMNVSITPGSSNGSPITMYGVRATFNKSTIFNPGENIGGQFTYTAAVNAPSNGGALVNHRFRLSSTPQRGSTFTIFGRVQNANGWGPWKQSGTLTVGGDA